MFFEKKKKTTHLFRRRRGDEVLLVVGVARDMTLSPRGAKQCYLHTYRFTDGGRGLSLLHRTPLDAIPGALAAFDGRLLAGVGATLRIYDIGCERERGEEREERRERGGECRM